MSSESENKSEITQLNEEIKRLHDAHYQQSSKGLIHDEMSPCENRIYHLYEDGEITNQKGSWAYQQRSEFPSESPIIHGESPFMLPISWGQHTYAILTYEECLRTRQKMKSVASVYGLDME
jgi:hypothetical protein